MNFRACRPDEHEAVAQLMLRLYEEDPASTQMTCEMALATLRRFAQEPVRGVVLVYDEGRGLEGYALLASFWSNEQGGEVCVIDELYFVAEARGRGLATWLLQALACGELPWFADAVALELEVTPKNTRARALYRRLGFSPYPNAMFRLRR
ncbi:GNAT family N-acetyltransferase [Myxococcota bacterium]|jgi:GNAT superfamily N-acetyltransferase|nr:GNAT family N-acetyltransferase [Myxococcota bacterium]